MVLEDVGHSKNLFRSEAFDVSKIRCWKHLLLEHHGSLFCDPYHHRSSVTQDDDSSEADEDENTIVTFASTPSKGPSLTPTTRKNIREVVIVVFDSPPRNGGGRDLNYSFLEDASSPKEWKAFWTNPRRENSTISYDKGSPTKKAATTITRELSSHGAAFHNNRELTTTTTTRGVEIELVEKSRGYGIRILFLLTLLSLGIVVYSMPSYWGLDAGLAVDHMKRQINRLDEMDLLIQGCPRHDQQQQL
jgi:hypothetical protein